MVNNLTKRRKQLDILQVLSDQCNIDPTSEDIILPITPSMTSSEEWNRFSFCTGNLFSPIAQVSIQEQFPLELAFAMTVHKAQGCTIDHVVIDLTHHPQFACHMKHAATFVAMSRVHQKSHSHLLEPITVQPRESLCWILIRD